MIRARGSAQMVLASMLAAIAATWVVSVLVAAIRIDLPRARPGDVRVNASTSRPAIGVASAHDTLVAAAVEVDPFSPEREAPSTRYGSDPGDDSASTEMPAQRALLKLVGTVIDDDGSSFAMCQLGDEQPRAVRVGERIGEYRLRAVRQGAADFAGPDGPITLRVPPPAP
jgi:hypothetical protein